MEAIYVRREGQKSHITIKSVENRIGPQTQVIERYHSASLRLPVDLGRKEAVEERLANMESHLNLGEGIAICSDLSL